MGLTWIYGVPGDSDVGVRRSHSRDMEHVGKLFRMLFLFHPHPLNQAGGDDGILSEQLKERNKKESESIL